MSRTEHIDAARRAKVETVVAWLQDKGANAEVAAIMDDRLWLDVARFAGVNPLSHESRLMVIGRLQEIASAAAMEESQNFLMHRGARS